MSWTEDDIAQFRVAMKALHDACERARSALDDLRLAIDPTFYEWNDEMDNCYPNIEWPGE